MDALTYIREETYDAYSIKPGRIPQLDKHRDARSSRSQNKWVSLVPGQAEHRYPPKLGDFGLTENGIPYYVNRAGRKKHLVNAHSRPRCFKKLRHYNGQISYFGRLGFDERSQPESQGKSSRTAMKLKAYWWDEAQEALQVA
jgi:hypothetical protein